MKGSSLHRRRWVAALALGVAVVVWLYWPQERRRHHGSGPPVDSAAPPASVPGGPSSSAPDGPSGKTPAQPGVKLAPSAAEVGSLLHSKAESAENDNDLINELFGDFRKFFRQGNPVGMNEDITAAILGDNPGRVAFLPPDHPAIHDGRIHDRWGTPFWFHSASSNVMEIRSAGPDKQLFTGDDIVLNDTGVEATLYQDPGTAE